MAAAHAAAGPRRNRWAEPTACADGTASDPGGRAREVFWTWFF